MILGIIVGIVESNRTDAVLQEILGWDYEKSFRWGLAITWWISGIVSGVIFYAIALILEYLEGITRRLHTLDSEVGKNNPQPPKLWNSKAIMSKLERFKL